MRHSLEVCILEMALEMEGFVGKVDQVFFSQHSFLLLLCISFLTPDKLLRKVQEEL
jgi:hypothetical protein